MARDATGIDTSPMDVKPLIEPAVCPSVQDTAVRLRLIRDVFGFSQRELAKRAGVTNSSISMIEQAQVSPSIQSLSRIVAAFPISLSDFFNFKLSVDESSHGESDNQRLINSCQQLDARIEQLLAGQCTVFGASPVDSCGAIISGSLQLTTLGGNQLLTQGDSFYIPARQLFRLINLTEYSASLFCCSLFVR